MSSTRPRRSPTCPACRGALEEGFVPDNAHSSVMQASWHPGAPEAQKFLGIPAGTKSDRKKLVAIEAWRCSACGLVQLYAPRRPPRK